MVSTPQVQAICSEIEEQVDKNLKRSPEHREGPRERGLGAARLRIVYRALFGEQARRLLIWNACGVSAPKLVLPDDPGGPQPGAAFGDLRSADSAVAP